MKEASRYVTEAELKQAELFRNVNIESIRGLLDRCEIKELKENDVLIKAGQQNNTVYILLSGELRIHIHALERKAVAILGPGESVGEMSVIDQHPASAFVVAEKPSRLLSMDENMLWSLVYSSHTAAANLLAILTKRLRHADAFIMKELSLDDICERYGNVDALTGLHNRYWLDRMLKRQFLRSIMAKTRFSIIMIDIDNFKGLNSTYGYISGDRILYSVARIISDYLRPSEMIARYGGDDFIILLPNLSIEATRAIAERVQNAVLNAPPLDLGGSKIPHPTISIGITEMKEGQTLEMFIDEMDKALHRAKQIGRSAISE